MRYIYLIILIGASVMVFSALIGPKYKQVQALKTEISTFDTRLSTAEALKVSREDLIAKYNSISKTDLDNIKVLLPDSVDNIRLIIQLDALATKNGLSSLRDVQYDTQKTEQAPVQQNAVQKPYGEFTMSFSTSGPYKNFLSFISDLEQNLRLVDVSEVKFSQGNPNLVDSLSYNIKLKTYWLKK
ncbi:MAG TPA: type 4a pilus biogenesis protein PilO [Candidatus Paceibacterota bacterium]|nr:type 4a pilus biogenesis protein PilO [Candidatus Paceibacterota bacterium]